MLFLFSIGRHVNKSQYKVVNNVQCLRGIICKLVVSESWFLCPDWLIGDSGTINLWRLKSVIEVSAYVWNKSQLYFQKDLDHIDWMVNASFKNFQNMYVQDIKRVTSSMVQLVQSYRLLNRQYHTFGNSATPVYAVMCKVGDVRMVYYNDYLCQSIRSFLRDRH